MGVLSNEAYRYCSVPFIQMCKEANTFLAYGLAYALGRESWHLTRIRLLVLLALGCSVAIEGELQFSPYGFALQAGHQCVEVLKLVLQSSLFTDHRLDAFTFTAIFSPLVCVSTAMVSVMTGVSGRAGAPVASAFERAVQFAPYLVANCLTAFGLNICG